MKNKMDWTVTIITVVVVILAAFWMYACRNNFPMAADPPPPAFGSSLNPVVIQYDINIPYADGAQALAAEHPNGLRMAPVAAQETFDFTAVYGRPNVYYGTTAPPFGTYQYVGIVVAPLSAASHDQFLARDWPGGCGGYAYEPTMVCAWLGHFAYAKPGGL